VVASIISVEVGLSVALIEFGLGVVVGNVFSLNPNTDWLVFIANFASIVLTFLAGAEVDPDDFRERFAASVSIGLVSFLGPFVVASLIAYGVLDWDLKAALIAGTALSTTSLAVVYAVLVETGLNATRIGNLIMWCDDSNRSLSPDCYRFGWARWPGASASRGVACALVRLRGGNG
jgi:Kef-type K+ transport system membrane component KefB